MAAENGTAASKPPAVKVFVSSVSLNKEIKQQQQRIIQTLHAKKILFDEKDIAVNQSAKRELRMLMRGYGGDNTPPKIFNGDFLCGDYEAFYWAVEEERLEEFLRLVEPKKPKQLPAAVPEPPPPPSLPLSESKTPQPLPPPVVESEPSPTTAEDSPSGTTTTTSESTRTKPSQQIDARQPSPEAVDKSSETSNSTVHRPRTPSEPQQPPPPPPPPPPGPPPPASAPAATSLVKELVKQTARSKVKPAVGQKKTIG